MPKGLPGRPSRVWGSWGLGFEALRVWGLGFEALRVWGLGFEALRVWVVGCAIQGLGSACTQPVLGTFP